MHYNTSRLRSITFTSPARYPEKKAHASIAVGYIKSDLDFMASRYIEMVTAFTLLRAGHASIANGETAKGEALVAKGEALYFGHLKSDDGVNADCWKQQEMYRLLGDDAQTIGYHAGLRE